MSDVIPGLTIFAIMVIVGFAIVLPIAYTRGPPPDPAAIRCEARAEAAEAEADKKAPDR